MSLALLFPGQGEDIVHGLRTWYEESDPVRRLVNRAAEELGRSPSSLFARGGFALRETEVFQPLSTALSLGIFEELSNRGIVPDLVGGHSLGEVPAVAAAGLVTPEAAVRLAAVRGRLMQAESRDRPGGMVVIPESDPSVVGSILAEAGRWGTVVVAAYNAPGQVAISGTHRALGRVSELTGATLLPVSGAWHSPAMAGAVDAFRETVRSTLTGTFRIRMTFNRTGRVESDPRCVPDLLAGQLVRPVRWTVQMKLMARTGLTDVVTPGPARALRGLVRACLGERVTINATETPAGLNRIGVGTA